MLKRLWEFSRQKLHIGTLNSFRVRLFESIWKQRIAIFVIALLAIPILGYIPDSNIPMSVNKCMLAEWLTLGFVALFFFKNKWHKAWALWIVMCMVMMFNRLSYIETNTIMFYMLFFQILANRLTDKNINLIYNGIAVIILIQFAMVVMQFFHIYRFYMLKPGYDALRHTPGVMGEINSGGALFAAGLPVFLRGKLKICIPLVIIGIFLCQSLMPMVSVAFGAFVYTSIMFPRLRFYIFGSAIVATVAYALKHDNISFLMTGNGRLETWKNIWSLISDKPIKGCGIGHFRVVFPAIDIAVFRKGSTVAWFTAHNEFLQVICEQGIIGFGLMMGFICSTIERFMKKITGVGLPALIGVIIILVNSTGHFVMHTTIGLIAITYFAIIINQIGGRDEKGNMFSRNIPSFNIV